MHPPSWTPPPNFPPQYQPQPQPGVPGAVIGFKIFAGFYAAFCLLLAVYGLLHVTGWDIKLDMVPPDGPRPVEIADWAVLAIFCALALAMLSCVFLRPEPRNWGVGLVALIIGLPCCLVPAVVLLVLWCQQPTRLYFATHGWKNLPQPPPPMPMPMPPPPSA